MNVQIHTFPLGSIADDQLVYAVSVALFDGQYVFVRHRLRDTWECPGGHIEPGESPLEAARRELWEETGAHTDIIEPVCIYRVDADGTPGKYGLLCRAQISHPGPLPEGSEMAEVRLFSVPPGNWTYPHIVPWLLKKAGS